MSSCDVKRCNVWCQAVSCSVGTCRARQWCMHTFGVMLVCVVMGDVVKFGWLEGQVTEAWDG